MKIMSEKRIAQAQVRFGFLGQITIRSQFGGYGLLVNSIMFAVVSEGELYLRANDNIEDLFRASGMANLVYAKRGLPVLLRYYRLILHYGMMDSDYIISSGRLMRARK